MVSSNHGGQGSGCHSPGRGFVSVDPEHQREVPPDSARPGTPDKGSASDAHPQPAVPGRPARPAASGRSAPPQDGDDEGGSGRRHRTP